MLKEEWRRLIYNGIDYGDKVEISNFGNARNLITNHIYKTSINKNGYLTVCISFGSRDKKKCFKIHRAVAETFIPNPYNLPEVNHIDGNKLNNGFWNLEWCTGSWNMSHAVSNGLQKTNKGSKNPLSTLSDEEIEYIRNNIETKTIKQIAKDLNRNYSALAEYCKKNNIRKGANKDA